MPAPGFFFGASFSFFPNVERSISFISAPFCADSARRRFSVSC